jgi:hypothetical protein
MTQRCALPEDVAPLTIEELEAGLQLLRLGDTDRTKFWDDYGAAFTETLRLASRETSAALRAPDMPPKLRAELEHQLGWLETLLARDGGDDAARLGPRPSSHRH